MKIPCVVMTSAVLLSLLGATCRADDTVTETERRNLIALVREIDQLHQLASQAQASSDKAARVQFDYQSLHRDLTAMSDAIRNHLDKPSRTPRKMPPLNSQYSTP